MHPRPRKGAAPEDDLSGDIVVRHFPEAKNRSTNSQFLKKEPEAGAYDRWKRRHEVKNCSNNINPILFRLQGVEVQQQRVVQAQPRYQPSRLPAPNLSKKGFNN